MSDFGELSNPQALKESASFAEVVKASSITEEAYSIAWGKGITGKHIDFPKEDGTLTWGVEITIPLEFDAVRGIYEKTVEQMEVERNIKISDAFKSKKLENKAGRRYYSGPLGIKLPEKIKSVKILDLSPQEALPQEQRNIPSHRTKYHEKYLTQNLVRGTEDHTVIDNVVSTLFKKDFGQLARIKALDSLFKDVFGAKSGEQIHMFLSKLSESTADEILFIHAHGGDNEIIGEETADLTRDEGYQNRGNRVSLDEVLNKYDDPNKTAAILLTSCYIGKNDQRTEKKKVPVFSVKGISGVNRSPIGQFFPSKTSVSLPDTN